MSARRFVLCVLVALGASVSAAQQPPPQPPRFQASVEVTSIDVTVVDDRGRPIADLKPADFVVRVDGNARRVVSAEWISLVTPATPPAEAAPVPEGFSSNESSTGGRLIVIAIDEPNIRFGGAMGIARAANAFIDRLSPSDRIAVAGFGTGAPATVFTADRAHVKQVISRMAGSRHGVRLDPGDLIAAARAAGRTPAQRTTLYEIVETY